MKLRDLLLENKKVTLANINKEAKRYGIKLVKGKGYFYWVPLDNNTDNSLYSMHDSSVYVYTVTELPWNSWMNELKDIVKRIKSK